MKMTHNKTKQVINVVAHFMTKNYWEYYVIDKPDNQGIGFALVLGFAEELGTYSQEEIKPYLLCYTENLNEVMPAPDWNWSD